jgi:hypothetical protein
VKALELGFSLPWHLEEDLETFLGLGFDRRSLVALGQAVVSVYQGYNPPHGSVSVAHRLCSSTFVIELADAVWADALLRPSCRA